ncbi:chromosome segregation protein SMC [Dermacoccus nishinomiyaensis]|uniref:chromosome segregation protein SMC n=1 Tax=Dermacoccus TaxID=57495 RepID=UPI00093C779F|nr:chromosome segregation protein SMC [Dermacoccus nishinomiyaensis]MBO1757670.1 chromosome segregation protein SMC [Dermacoccus sp. NHGro5]
MYVKSLTLKGFKSFASATNLVLEPGITCIVGPNGSGKSNVVDALAWVMGEGSARSLRGGKMDDVIFAGTSGRRPLGRAEVTMTIDNSDGALPIDYTEVTISRTMFRGGGSEYAINRTPCRLLDIQELLSDSGIGKEMHVIVGQGQLDAVLRATPEERRGFIEEAAGVLKHRRRKEKALRKLDGMEANLTRVADLTAEVRRQLGPLGRQAETARRAQAIQMTVRDARLRLLADDLVQQRARLEADVADEQAMVRRRAELDDAVRAAKAGVEEIEAEIAARAPVLERLQSQWYALLSLEEKLDSTRRLAAERATSLTAAQDETPGSGRDPEQLRRQAERVRGEELELQAEVERAQEALDAAVEVREKAEREHQVEQQRLVRIARAAADRREGLAKLHGQVEVRRSRVEAGEAELARLRASIGESATRVAQAQEELAPLEEALRDAEAAEAALNDAAEKLRADHAALLERRRVLRDERNTSAQRRSASAARAQALDETLGSDTAGLENLPAEAPGVLGDVVSRLEVEPGHEAGVSLALGWAAEALLVDSHTDAAALLAALRAQDGGRVALLVAGDAPHDVTTHDWPTLPEGGVWVRDVASVPATMQSAFDVLVDRLAIVPDADGALALVHAGARAVTLDGDVYEPTAVRGGGRPGRSRLEVRAAHEQAVRDAEIAADAEQNAENALEALTQPLAAAQDAADDAAAALAENDARIEELMAALARHHQAIAAASHERDRINDSIEQASVALDANREELMELEMRLDEAQAEPGESEPSVAERDRLATLAATAREQETEQRLTLRTLQERVRAIAGRAESLEAAARSEVAARERAQARRVRRREATALAQAVERTAELAREQVRRARDEVTRARDAEQASKATRDEALRTARVRLQECSDQLREVTDSVHRDEMARAQQRLRIEALETRAVEELGIDPDVLVEEFGPHLPVPLFEAGAGMTAGEKADTQASSGRAPSGQGSEGDDADGGPPSGTEPVASRPFERALEEKRLRTAERDLKQLGKINPLALEEYAALEERHTFLSEQLADLRGSKKDLLSIVSEVDARVEQVFTEAFHDVAREFEGVFSRLFPGGEGRLVLTDPENMLTTGLDVEARPPGKRIKRLSLLSGGERSLVAVALLVSIFKARPSPFYIMDEVEAALDDANLGRLITLFEELRDSSQLIVITHQKRTMEVADALYGVTMRGDGVTTVVSQRLADVRVAPEPAEAS